MSHLTILPTVLRDADLLVSALEGLQLRPQRGGVLNGFAGERQAVEVCITLRGGLQLGWSRQPDGSLALVGDLPRLSRSQDVPPLLGAITKAYAARLALREAATLQPGAEWHVVC